MHRDRGAHSGAALNNFSVPNVALVRGTRHSGAALFIYYGNCLR